LTYSRYDDLFFFLMVAECNFHTANTCIRQCSSHLRKTCARAPIFCQLPRIDVLSYPCVTPTTTLLSASRSFLSCIFFPPVCASYVARICVTFNYPPTHRPGFTHAIVQIASNLLSFLHSFLHLSFCSSSFACSDRAACLYKHIRSASFLFYSF
jgi:hypothetical protein